MPVRLEEDQIERIDRLASKIGARSRSEFLRSAIDHYLDVVSEMKVIRLRKNVPKERMKKEIIEYLRGKREADTFDIANDLKLDLDSTIQSLKELWEEGRVL